MNVHEPSTPEFNEIELALKDDNNIIFKERSRLSRGEGAFGYTASATAERKVVLKHILIGESDNLELIMREANNLKRLTYHRHIVRFYNVTQMVDAMSGRSEVILELEYCQGGTLRTEIYNQDQLGQSFAPKQVRSWIIQLARAVNYLHELAIAHRDIKPENILLTKGKIIKLGDFGLSKLIGEVMPFTRGFLAGTPEYMAPEKFNEALRGDFSTDALELLNDVWSIGVVGYEVAALRRPFILEHRAKYKSFVDYYSDYRVPDEPLRSDPWASCGHKELIERMLTYQPQYRPSMASLMKEPYFVDNIPDSVPQEEVDELHRRYVERGRKIKKLAQKKGELKKSLNQTKEAAEEERTAFLNQLQDIPATSSQTETSPSGFGAVTSVLSELTQRPAEQQSRADEQTHEIIEDVLLTNSQLQIELEQTRKKLEAEQKRCEAYYQQLQELQRVRQQSQS